MRSLAKRTPGLIPILVVERMLWLAVAAAAEQATVDAHGEVSDAFDAALRLNAAEHDAQMEVACSHFFCGAAADYDVPPMSRHSMGPVQMLNDYSETLEGEDQIFVSEQPLFSPEECEEVIRLTELEGEGLPSSQSGKYKLGKAWIKDMPQVKEWFNEALRTKLFPTLAHLFPSLVSSASMLRAHSVAVLRYNASHPHPHPHPHAHPHPKGTTPRTLARTSTWTTRCSPSRWRSRTRAPSRAAAPTSSTSTECCPCRRVTPPSARAACAMGATL